MESVIFMKANKADIEMMSRMRLDFLTEYFGNQNEDVENVLLDSLRKYLANLINKSTIFGYAKCDDIITGNGFFEIHDQPGNFKNPIMNMYTLKLFRKKGIFTTILNKLVESASKIGVSAFELNASKDGMPVYAKNGFRLHPDPTMRMHIG